MKYLEHRPYLHPERHQCNFQIVVLNGEQLLVGVRCCPKDVWAEMRILTLTHFDNYDALTEQTQGFYCQAHYIKLLPGVTKVNRDAETRMPTP